MEKVTKEYAFCLSLALQPTFCKFKQPFHQNKMLSSKKFKCKGTLQQAFIRVHRLEMQSVMLVFSTQLCKLLPLYPSLWFTSPPSQCQSTVYTLKTVCCREGMEGVESCWRPYSAGV
jgi:hypothetical protein